MTVVDLVKKSLAFSVGCAALSAEKLKQFADDMVARGEMSSEDAKSFVDDVSKKAEEEMKAVQDWIRDQVSRVIQTTGAAEASRVEELERRVAALEKCAAEMRGGAEIPDDPGGTAAGD